MVIKYESVEHETRLTSAELKFLKHPQNFFYYEYRKTSVVKIRIQHLDPTVQINRYPDMKFS